MTSVCLISSDLISLFNPEHSNTSVWHLQHHILRFTDDSWVWIFFCFEKLMTRLSFHQFWENTEQSVNESLLSLYYFFIYIVLVCVHSMLKCNICLPHRNVVIKRLNVLGLVCLCENILDSSVHHKSFSQRPVKAWKAFWSRTRKRKSQDHAIKIASKCKYLNSVWRKLRRWFLFEEESVWVLVWHLY